MTAGSDPPSRSGVTYLIAATSGRPAGPSAEGRAPEDTASPEDTGSAEDTGRSLRRVRVPRRAAVATLQAAPRQAPPPTTAGGSRARVEAHARGLGPSRRRGRPSR